MSYTLCFLRAPRSSYLTARPPVVLVCAAFRQSLSPFAHPRSSRPFMPSTNPGNPLNAASSCDSACVCYVTERDAMIYVAHPGLARPDPLDAPYSTLIASLAYISSLLPPAASCLCANPARAIAAGALPRCAARCLEASTL